MSEFPALNATYWAIFIYLIGALFPVYMAIFAAPKSRVGYMLLGAYIMFFAAFILTATSESIALVSELSNDLNNSLSPEEIAGLMDFRKNIRFLGFLVTFLIGGVGVSVFTKVVPSLGKEPVITERILSELNELKSENKKIKTGLLFILALVIIGTVYEFMPWRIRIDCEQSEPQPYRIIGQAIAQIIIGIVAAILILTGVGVTVGSPIAFVVWIWTIINAAIAQPDPIKVVA